MAKKEISSLKKAEISKDETLAEIYKQEIAPPKKNIRTDLSIRSVILVLIIALLGGLAAGFIKDNFFGTYLYELGYGNLNKNVNQQPDEQKQVLDLNFLLDQSGDDYQKVLNELRAPMVGFYRAKALSANILENIYLEKDFLGSGVVATSDGWLLTHLAVLAELDDDFVVVTSNKEVLEPVQVIRDPFSGLVMVKVEKNNLSPVRFADTSVLSPTSNLLTTRYSIQNHGSDIIKTSLQKFSYHDQSGASNFLLSTEKIDHYFKIADKFERVYNGAALINQNNEVAGLMFYSGVDYINLAVPAYYLKSAVSNFLANSQEIIRPSLGVNYVDLSEVVGLSDQITEGQQNGAVLLGDSAKNILAVKADSSAEEAGLLAGDIILKVNGEEVDEKNSLTKLVQSYSPGQEINFDVIRAGEELKVKAVLEEL